MLYIGAGLHILVALYFAVHALRHRQPVAWLAALFLVPLVGNLVYLFAVVVPLARRQRRARKTVARMIDRLDPRRPLRDAQAAYAYAPTPQAEMRLAMALLEAGAFDDAAAHFDACLKGPFSGDLEARLGAARAAFATEHWAKAIAHLVFIRKAAPAYQDEMVSLLLARTLAGAGRRAEARVEFEHALARFDTFEARVEFAIWAIISGELDLAARLQAEIQAAMHRWNRHTRDRNRPLLRRLQAAYEVARAAR